MPFISPHHVVGTRSLGTVDSRPRSGPPATVTVADVSATRPPVTPGSSRPHGSLADSCGDSSTLGFTRSMAAARRKGALALSPPIHNRLNSPQADEDGDAASVLEMVGGGWCHSLSSRIQRCNTRYSADLWLGWGVSAGRDGTRTRNIVSTIGCRRAIRVPCGRCDCDVGTLSFATILPVHPLSRPLFAHRGCPTVTPSVSRPYSPLLTHSFVTSGEVHRS